MTIAEKSSGWYSAETATLGDRLTGAREAAGLSQKALATRLGVKTSTLASWEDDMAEPRANRLQLLAGMLGVSLMWLLNGEGEGVEDPGDAVQKGGDPATLAEIRQIRAEMSGLIGKLKRLEQRLQSAPAVAQ